MLKMKKALIMAAALAILVAPAAQAKDIVCHMTDTLGNALTYAFGANSQNADGSFGGTMVETGFEKNGRMVLSEVGNRPIWTFSGDNRGFTLYSREAPGWAISIARNDAAVLTHNGYRAGYGSCGATVAQSGPSADTVGDLGVAD
jgi:hypothetical protein